MADAIEAELKALGRWSNERPAEEKFVDMGAFGMRTLAPEQWLQFVLVPRIREIVSSGGEFPKDSAVATWAVRNFDGDDEAGKLLTLLNDLDDLFPRTAPVRLFSWAVSGGEPEEVRALLDAGADPNGKDSDDVAPLFFAAAGGHVALAAFLADPDGTDIHASHWPANPTTPGHLEIAKDLLSRGAAIDERYRGTGATPLIVAVAFGNDAVAELLTQHGANGDLSDAQSRTASDWKVLRLIARLRHVLAGISGVKAAYLAQLFFPGTRQFTTPLLGLDLDGPLPPGAFADIPPADPVIAMLVGDDAVSRLMRLGSPFYVRV